MKSKSATKAQKRRMLIIKRDVGCIACHILYGLTTPADAHHLLDGGRRMGHDFTIPLCPEHHTGQKLSTHKTKIRFQDEVGTDEYLLALTNCLVAVFEKLTTGASNE